MTLDEGIKVLEMQEEILQFSHFTNSDAWELGNMLVADAAKRGARPLISIRLNNGYTVFQYAFDGTAPHSQQWIERKFNTVKEVEKSTLHFNMLLQKTEETLEDLFEEPGRYTATGGGFPIRVEEVGVIGGIMVSGLDLISNHDLIVKCVGKYLHIDEVPRITTVKW